MTSEEKIAHLGFIQASISRMAGNVFLVKGWTVALVAAMTALTSDSRIGSYIAIVPAFLFWWLDAFYMRQERLFRDLYVAVATNNPAVAAFSMDTDIVKNGAPTIFRCMFSKTVWLFYVLIFILLAVFVTKGVWWDKSEKEERSQVAPTVTRETYVVLVSQIAQAGTFLGFNNVFHQPK